MLLERTASTLMATLAALVLLGCGTDRPSSSTSGKTPVSGGSRQFETAGGDNSIQRFGAEAGASERAAAAAALHGYLDARASGNWRVACSYLAPPVLSQLARLADARRCPQVLSVLSAGVPPAARREAAVADVGSFRTDGGSGFVLFHGARRVDYFVPMTRAGRSWKVAAVAPSLLGAP